MGQLTGPIWQTPVPPAEDPSLWRDPCFLHPGKGVRMKKHERRAPFGACCALWMTLACALFAPLACGDDSSPGPTGGTGGTGATGGTGGTAGTSGNTDAGGEMCGGFASLRCAEPDLTFCDYEAKATCGQMDATGTCTPRPDTCTKDCPGVCGCDGKFYCNECEAHRAGTDDVPSGTCSDAGNLTR
jgi:hypothetical protein